MPFVNGRFYLNPAHGRSVERARAAEMHQTGPSDEHAEHWVTINGRHVLIQSGQAARSNAALRRSIAETARKYDGSTDWAYSKRKGNFAPNTNKCTQYVYDVTKEAGVEVIVIGIDGKPRAPLAAEWADPNTKIANWTVLGKNETPQPGDVAAYKLPGGGVQFSGHSGIVSSVSQNGYVVAEAAHEDAVGPDEKFSQTGDSHHVVYRRFRGGSQ